VSFRWRARRLSVYPDEVGIAQDVCDVTLWLIEKHGLSRVLCEWTDTYTHVGRQIAGVTVMTSPRHPARLTEAARQAFFSLDQEIEDMSADIYGHQFCDDHPARHEAIQAYPRVEGAL